jgi:ADP-dependent NAD(P)H-hydrate dehydratase / NAD(P)H-hydrate epimerase
MQKILSVPQIREADAFTIANEPITSVDLMERAGHACFSYMSRFIPLDDQVGVVAGRGNNGGDGLVIARLLHDRGYSVTVFLVGNDTTGSPDFMVNLERLQQLGVQPVSLDDGLDDLVFEAFDWLVDALFGSGLTRPVTGLSGRVIDAMNHARSHVVSIDIPSGLFADTFTSPLTGSIVEADTTLSLELPKLAMLMPSCYLYTGLWKVVSIGLHKGFLRTVYSPYRIFCREDAVAVFMLRDRVSHKGNHGHGMLVAGSRGKGGAALLAAHAALRSGIGLLTAAIPEVLELPFHVSLPEAMLRVDPLHDETLLREDLDHFEAIAMGPGCGVGHDAEQLLKGVIQSHRQKLLLDADALNLLSMYPEWLCDLPENTILTPHPKEFDRLAGKAQNDFHRLELAAQFARHNKCVVVLKTAFPVVVTPHGTCTFSVQGNAGLAKGGSGDALTGVILGLLCRGYPAENAALLGVWLHARAATLVAETTGLDAMLPSDVIRMLGKAFRELETEKLLIDPVP